MNNMKTIKLDKNQLEASSKLSPLEKASVLPASKLPSLAVPALASATIDAQPKGKKPKTKKPDASPAAPAEAKPARDIKQYLVKIPVDKQSRYDRRLYLREAFSSDVPVDEEQRAKTTFYHLKDGSLAIYSTKVARQLIKAWMLKTRKEKDVFTTDDIITYHKVFGCGFGDNTRSALNKFIKQGFLSRKRVPPTGKRFHYEYTVLKQIPADLSV